MLDLKLGEWCKIPLYNKIQKNKERNNKAIGRLWLC